MQHAAMYMQTSGELRSLLPGCTVLELAGSNVTMSEGSAALSEVATDPKAWEMGVSLERRVNTEPGLVDMGSHVILVAPTVVLSGCKDLLSFLASTPPLPTGDTSLSWAIYR